MFSQLTQSFAKKYNAVESKSHNTSKKLNLSLKLEQSDTTNWKSINLIGAFFSTSTSTRPYVSYSTNYSIRFQNCSDKIYFEYSYRALKYLYYLRNLKLTYVILTYINYNFIFTSM